MPRGRRTPRPLAGRSSAGPTRPGSPSPTKAPPIEFGPDKNVLWKTAVPAGHSSPVFWGDRIFLTAFDGERKQLLVMALDRATGRELWRKDVPYESLGTSHPLSTPATATPVVDGERVYAYLVQAGLFAFALDGAPAWRLRCRRQRCGSAAERLRSSPATSSS